MFLQFDTRYVLWFAEERASFNHSAVSRNICDKYDKINISMPSTEVSSPNKSQNGFSRDGGHPLTQFFCCYVPWDIDPYSKRTKITGKACASNPRSRETERKRRETERKKESEGENETERQKGKRHWERITVTQLFAGSKFSRRISSYEKQALRNPTSCNH